MRSCVRLRREGGAESFLPPPNRRPAAPDALAVLFADGEIAKIGIYTVSESARSR